MPPAADRMTPFTLIQVDETLEANLPENAVIHEDISYTNRKGLHFTPDREGETLILPFDVSESGNYLVFARVWPRGDAGVYDFYLNEQLLVEAKDLFEEHHFVTDIKLGNMHNLEKGTHILKAVYRGTSNPGAPGNLFIDAIVLEPVGSFEKRNTN